MGLWELPDDQETAKKVDWFLKSFLKRLSLRTGHSLTDIASPSFDSAPSHSSRNGVERKMQKNLEALEALKAIKEAMLRTSGFYPKLLIKFYLKRDPVWKIRDELLIDHDSFREYKEIALNQFADIWEAIQEKYDFDDKIDLHVYPDQKEVELKSD